MVIEPWPREVNNSILQDSFLFLVALGRPRDASHSINLFLQIYSENLVTFMELKINLKNMKSVLKNLISLGLLLVLVSGCGKDGQQGPQGPAGQDATVYYSEWFSPTVWAGASGDWYFDAGAPDLTEDIIESGVVLAYAWLEGDLYSGNSVRPLPAYAVGANWSFLVYQYGIIEFTCDMTEMPATSGNKFRFIAIPGTIPALKSSGTHHYSKDELRNMTYKKLCKTFNIPE